MSRRYQTISFTSKNPFDILETEINERNEKNFSFHYLFINIKGEISMLRSIKKACELIHANDPESAIKVHTLRTWCKESKIKFLTVGNKILIDMDSLYEYIGQKQN